MNVDIRDKSALASLRLLDVIAYLRATGWQQSPRTSSGQMWTHRDFEVLLPGSRDVRDFALRMGDALVVLSTFEQRAQVEIFNDLVVTSADVIRIRASESESGDGTVPLREG